MSFLNNDEKLTLAEQIKAAESQTSGEIVTVIAGQSDGYRYIPLLWAALIALSIPGWYFLYQTLLATEWVYPGESISALAQIYPLQVLVFLGFGMLLQIPRIGLWFVPKAVKKQRAARHAREQFFLQNLHLTKQHTGLLIFVSVAEHYVEIIVDSSIAAVVDDKEWADTVQEFIDQIHRGDIATGFANTVAHCGDVLHKHFPAEHGRPDELPNHLIEI